MDDENSNLNFELHKDDTGVKGYGQFGILVQNTRTTQKFVAKYRGRK